MNKLRCEMTTVDKGVNTGENILKMLQDNDTPIIDLYIRESIQNSYDAIREKEQKVNIKYKYGTFDNKKLSSYFEKIDIEMERFGSKCEYLAVTDTNTTGLTGPIKFSDVSDEDTRNYKFGNFLNLCYQSGITKNSSESGGSWGYGKSVYYKIGEGLVIYYTRIKKNQNFEERLTAVLIEDTSKEDCIIKESHYTGLAFFGDLIEENGKKTVIPFVDSPIIKEILNCFDISPLVSNNTGTIIISPYISSRELLKKNCENAKFDYENAIAQQKDFEEALIVATQRWYFSQIKNKRLTKYLDVRVNGKEISTNHQEDGEMYPLFMLFREMYDFALNINEDLHYLDINETSKIDITVNIKRQSIDAGKCIITKISEDKLYSYRDFNINPYVLLNENVSNSNEIKRNPIIFYCRKPGMIVNYDKLNTNWNSHKVTCDSKDYIFVLFVLNSDVEFLPNYKLEKYFRKIEMAVHKEWKDSSIEVDGTSKNYKLVERIQSRISDELMKKFKNEEQDKTTTVSKLANRLGKLFCPPEFFGKKPTGIGSTPNGGITRKKNYSFYIESISYDSYFVTLKIVVKINRFVKKVIIYNDVITEAKNYSPKEWINESLSLPYEIEKASIQFNKDVCLYQVIKDREIDNQDKKIKFCYTNLNDNAIGVMINNYGKQKHDLLVIQKLRIEDFAYKTSVRLEVEEEGDE